MVRLLMASALCGLVACDEKGAAPPPDDDATTTGTTTSNPDASGTSTTDVDYGDTTYEIPESPAPAVRRLSVRELENSYVAILGFAPKALSQVPPDPRDYTFDRVVNAQTVSSIHAEAFDAAASEAADRLIAEQRLDDFAAACSDDILPPPVSPTTSVTTGIGVVAYPDWALLGVEEDPDRLLIRYAPECGASVTQGIAVDGTYRITLDAEFIDTFDIALSIDGIPTNDWSLAGKQQITYDVALTAGSHLIAFDFVFAAGGNPYVWIDALSIEGPLDLGASHVEERAACATALTDALGARAFRRPLTAQEQIRIGRVVNDAQDDGGSWGEAIRLAMRVILGNPKFLYLVEQGTPIDAQRFALNDYEIAQRLSYAICEMPPDEPLRTAAAASLLHTPEQIREQAERLFTLPCAEDVVMRFYRQWLWLERLPETAKDPQLYPEFSAAIASAMATEADNYLHKLTFDDKGDVVGLYQSAFTASVDSSPRAGILTLPGVLTVTAKFAQTSPVIRGVYVLEQILCQDLPAPPIDVDTTPPELDPTMTSRERWRIHSESPACADCHTQIDPIGFTFEEYDAMGRLRETENGLPIDAKGAVPALDATGLDGVSDVASLIATSDLATSCLARQWLRFAIGRLEETPDAAAIAEVGAALKGENGLVKGFIALTGTSAFRERVERAEGETP